MIKIADLLRVAAFVTALVSVIAVNGLIGTAQQSYGWMPQRAVPDYHPETEPPYLVADQNRTVHAFSSQSLGEDEGQSVKAILYNQWTLERGWTVPVDIMLSPVKEARILGAFLDRSGIMHMIFYGGDNTAGDIYYTKAPAVDAGQAPAWSTPVLVGEAANDPSVAALTGDDKGNLAIVYSGKQDGWGLYTLYSADGGETWTEPVPMFLTYAELIPFALNLSRGESGVVHAVWDVRDLGGNGRRIYYAGLNLDDQQWTEPVTLAEAETGYGVLIPTVVEHGDEVIVAYSGVTMRSSKDGGKTWTAPVNPFRQVGVNGAMSFVVDSNDDLHFLWAQRITASPDIHGVWHSMWLDGRWTEPEAVVSGPRVNDASGYGSFDPYEVRAVVSQGNVLLVTWRTDPGPQNRANGVWYSYVVLEAPQLSQVPLPTALAIPVSTLTPTTPPPAHTQTPPPALVKTDDGDALAGTPPLNGTTFLGNPAFALAVGLVPVVLLIGVIMIKQSLRS
jgi:hypothetical protein